MTTFCRILKMQSCSKDSKVQKQRMLRKRSATSLTSTCSNESIMKRNCVMKMPRSSTTTKYNLMKRERNSIRWDRLSVGISLMMHSQSSSQSTYWEQKHSLYRRRSMLMAVLKRLWPILRRLPWTFRASSKWSGKRCASTRSRYSTTNTRTTRASFSRFRRAEHVGCLADDDRIQWHIFRLISKVK